MSGSDMGSRALTAIVTGAAQGIGAAEALRLAADGYRVILNDVKPDGLQAVIGRSDHKDRLVSVPGDISDPETAQALVAEATRAGYRLETVVNNAAIVGMGMVFDLSPHDWDSVMAVNARGAFLLSREAARYWRDSAKAEGTPLRANLINTTSRSALLANPGQTNYAASKAAVAVMTQTMARELRAFGVRCNAIAPRAYTAMTWENVGEFEPSRIPEWSPDHVAEFVSFLCGPGGDGISGQIFVVHGPRVAVARTWQVSEPVEMDYAAGPDSVLDRLHGLFGEDPMQISAARSDADMPLLHPRKSPFEVEELGTAEPDSAT
jgi:3-oxoacyl-[acyl-carrier protein] reductase